MGQEAFDVYAALKPAGNPERFRFADWRNRAVTLDGERCGSAVYTRSGEAFLVLANFAETTRELLCKVRLDHPSLRLKNITSASLLEENGNRNNPIDPAKLTGEGVKIRIPADSAVLVQLK